MTDVTVVYTPLDAISVALFERGLLEMFKKKHTFAVTNERERVSKYTKLLVFVYVHEDTKLSEYEAIGASIPNFDEIYYRPNTLYVVIRGRDARELFEPDGRSFFYSEVVSLRCNVAVPSRPVFADLHGYWDAKYKITKFLEKPLDPPDTRVRFRELPERDLSPARTPSPIVENDRTLIEHQLAEIREQKETAEAHLFELDQHELRLTAKLETYL